MGVDLTLIPDRFDNGPWLAYERLSLDMRHYELWGRLRAIATPMEKPLFWYGDEGCSNTTTDADGENLTFVLAYHMCKELEEVGEEYFTPWDKAVLAFLQALPPQKRIVLYFH
jgi:hypothetical protein